MGRETEIPASRGAETNLALLSRTVSLETMNIALPT